ncbi:hypothetical protein D3C81_1337840 [compost metagenome]
MHPVGELGKLVQQGLAVVQPLAQPVKAAGIQPILAHRAGEHHVRKCGEELRGAAEVGPVNLHVVQQHAYCLAHLGPPGIACAVVGREEVIHQRLQRLDLAALLH